MPHNKPEDNTPKGSKNSASKAQTSAVENETHSSSEEVKQQQTEHHEHKPDKPRVVNIGKIPKNDIVDRVNKEAKAANTISRYSVVVNGFLLFVTAGIGYISFMQARSADNSANIAKKTYKADSANNERIYIRDSIRQISTDLVDKNKKIHEDSVFNLQKDALNLQIKSLEQSQDQFIKQNEPYLYINKIQNIRLRVNQSVAFDFKIENISNNPVDVTSIGSMVHYEASTVTSLTNTDRFFNKIPMYDGVVSIQPHGSFDDKFDGEIPMTQDQIDQINSGKEAMYFIGIRDYTNVITNKKYKLKFVVRIIMSETRPIIQPKTMEKIDLK